MLQRKTLNHKMDNGESDCDTMT